jgi:Ca2+-binding RTX toxin-like protein
MNTARAQRSASPAFIIAVAVGLMAILGPLAGPALSSHTTIDATPNSDTNPVGTSHSVTATTPGPGVMVNFDIETGPNSDGGPPLGTASDFECTSDAVAPHQCAFSYEGTGGAGTDEIRVWSDEGTDDDVFQAAEPNELVTKTWVEQDPATATLDCAPESDTNPVGGPDSSHEITCTVTDSSGEPFLGAEVDFENETTNVNDPDDNATRTDSGVVPEGGPERSCATSDAPDSDGTCSVTYPSEGETGTATIRAWVDVDGDDTTDESDGAEGASQTDSDGTDVVSKTWVVSTVDGSPNTDTNPVGTEHTITATTSEPGQEVNFNVESGPNSDDGDLTGEPSDDECTTDPDAAGGHTCSVSYAGSGGAGQDNVRVWIDTDTGNNDTFETGEPNDFVEKNWVEQDPAQATLDCDPETGENPLTGSASSHTITCTVLDQNGEPFLGAEVDFENESPTVNDPDDDSTRTASGAIPTGGPDQTCTTSEEPDSDGTCTATYESEEEEGTATIRAWVDEDGDDTTDESDSTETRSPDDVDNTDVVQKTWDADFRPPPAPCRNDQPDDNIFVGTSGDDRITGTPGDDIICALGGDDRVNGRGGDDLILLGDGNDRADAGRGRDTVRGGRGRDSVDGGAGADTLRGEAGRDNLRGDSGADTISGGAGNDTVSGGDGRDRMNGNDGNDTLRGGDGADRLAGGDGRDNLIGGSGPDRLDGGRGSDRCRGGPGRDRQLRCER